MSTVRPIPEVKEGAVPYLCVRGGREAIDFYVRAFGSGASFSVSRRLSVADAFGRELR